MALLPSVTAAIGGTPLIRLDRLAGPHGIEIFGKLEAQNPAGSVKDRIARAMVDDAEARGMLAPGATLIEPTSGNTGIALAMICASRGYRLVLTMPEAMSKERVGMLRAYGAEVILTPGSLMRAAVDQAEMLGRTTPGAVMLRQFENPANPAEHEHTTGPEIWADTGGRIDAFVAGVGTGGTISGVGRALRRHGSKARIVAVEPAAAPALSGGAVGPHGIQGIGAGFVPKNVDRSVIDEVIAVEDDEAVAAARRLAREEGLFCGVSSGAALTAALRWAARAPRPEADRPLRVVIVLPDGGERYLSTV